MSLKIVSPSARPLSFDMLDSEVTAIKGGEVLTLVSTASTSDEHVASDGYVFPNKRVVATKSLSNGNRPLFLSDDGIAGYGTMFGSIVGGVAGQNVAGTVLGPSTITGSGKVTAHMAAGVFGVSLDAVAADIDPKTSGLNTGAPLYATSAGLLTSVSGSAFEVVAVGRFIEFETNGSLVNTPQYLVSALNKSYSFAIISFNPPV